MATMSKRERRARAAKRKRQQNLWWIGGGAVVAALLIFVIVTAVLNQRPVGAEETLKTQGNMHIADESASPIDYNSTPPTSGPHYESIVPWGVYTDPHRYERIVHNLEDGGVAIYYQCEDGCPDLVAQLEEVVAPYLRANRHVVVVPNIPDWQLSDGQRPHQDMGNRIALTAWQKLDKFDDFDAERIEAFIDRYQGIDHHQ